MLDINDFEVPVKSMMSTEQKSCHFKVKKHSTVNTNSSCKITEGKRH